VSRLWAKDHTLWPVEPFLIEPVKSNLHWLDLPDDLEPLLNRVVTRAAQIEPAGFEDVVFITMGYSDLAARSVLRLPGARLGKRTLLLDTVDPDSVREFAQKLRLEKTLFIVVSKSGKNIETHSLFLYFLDKLKAAGVPAPARQIVGLTEESSYLDEIAKEYDFVDAFLDPPGISGRYSSLIHFNFFLGALCRMDPGTLIGLTKEMRELCRRDAPIESNPAGALASFLAAAHESGLDRMVLFSPSILQPMALRIGCLVGASIGKKGKGFVPIYGCPMHEASALQRRSFAIVLSLNGSENSELDKRSSALKEAGVPMISINLNAPKELAAELFKWEIATALTCSLLCVNPVHDPDLRESRMRSAQILEHLVTRRQSIARAARIREQEIELFAEGETRKQISTLNLSEALRTFFGLRHQDGYIAILPFLTFEGAHKQTLLRIRNLLNAKLGTPVVLTPGPRFSQSLGQVYLGGPPKGTFLLLTAAPKADLPIPGSDYSFGQLQLALAIGEFESLCHRRSPVIRLHLPAGVDRGLPTLEALLHSVLSNNPMLSP